MAMGPGRYNRALTLALKKAKATMGVLIVVNGEHGPSFCCQLNEEVLLTLPQVLRDIADGIEADIKTNKHQEPKKPWQAK